MRWIIANRFEINDPERDLLIRGSMGDVYRGTDAQTGQPVAIKALKPDLVAEYPDAVARFVREGEALRRLKHPNIVRIVAAVEDKGKQYLVMEYVEGGSLRNLMDEQGALPITRALEIAIDLANALFHAHRQGIVHRDLKPTNVLLARDAAPRLTDFGVAYVAGSTCLTDTGMRIGTVNYFSPEACAGEKLDERADIWALGVMLYEMLTGQRPFTGKTVNVTATAILTQPIPDLAQLRPDVSPTLAELIYHMLEKDSKRRIPSMRLVEEGLKLEARLHARRATSSPLSPSRRSGNHT
jgi:serine/threonine protein kinase